MVLSANLIIFDLLENTRISPVAAYRLDKEITSPISCW